MSLPARLPVVSGALALLLLLAGCPDDDLGQVFPDLEVSLDSMDFGRVPVLHVSILEREITNRGLARLTIEEVEIAGEDADFFFAGEIDDVIDVGAQRALPVSFQPAEERSYRAVLRIRSDDPEEPVVEIDLSGEGSTVSAIEVDPASLHFGLVGEGVVALETFSVHSVGSADLVVEEMVFEEGTSAAYAAMGSWATPAVIEAGESIDLAVTFSPEPGLDETQGAVLITSTDLDRRTVRLPLEAEVSLAPVADCGEEEILRAPGDVVILDGSGSYDPDGYEPLEYAWEVVRRPLTSLTELDAPDTADPSLELDVSGTWELSLSVTNTLGTPSSSPCRTTIRAVPAERLFIELVWEHSVTDLDLHVLRSDGSLFGTGDCWWDNSPVFGCEHSGDDLAGFGPEWARFLEPDAGTYQVLVHYRKDNGADDPVTSATLRVYQYGVLEAEMRRSLHQEGLVWEVLNVEWPSGEVEPIDVLREAP